MTTHFPALIQALLYSYHDHSLSWLITGTSITKYHDHSEWSLYCVIEVPVLSQESEWSWYFFYRSACIKPGKWVVMILLYSYHDHSLSWQYRHFYAHIMTTPFPALIQALLYSYHDHSLSWLNTGTSIEVHVLSQESEWSWPEYRSACIKSEKWVVMIWV
jgi:hypothetical protein